LKDEIKQTANKRLCFSKQENIKTCTNDKAD